MKCTSLAFSFFVGFALISPALATTASPDSTTAPCRGNFSVNGGRLSGYTLSTFQDFPAVSPNSAFSSLAKAIAADGGVLQNTNEKLGTFSALGALGPNVAAARPVTALVTALRPGSHIVLSWGVGPFVAFHRGDVEARFCKWLSRVATDIT